MAFSLEWVICQLIVEKEKKSICFITFAKLDKKTIKSSAFSKPKWIAFYYYVYDALKLFIFFSTFCFTCDYLKQNHTGRTQMRLTDLPPSWSDELFTRSARHRGNDAGRRQRHRQRIFFQLRNLEQRTFPCAYLSRLFLSVIAA